ncbi:hypothetical protein BDN70DRAFT_896145 [Pholiota conissans]|uniref:Uncharacterized protein n=1 Tax=Pholiota conissans TaxID=109636 RepID=A0A9P5YY61_9AGAR|nr:hypothetical protein BDN70DRAFT_896145 [Pholiota conissans]
MAPRPSPAHMPPLPDLDNLSDSDWLDIASGRDSDDNDSLSDSDRDEISSLPRSRRSSISNDDSMSSDVEAWEGFVSDAGEEHVTGMYPMPLPSPPGAEPVFIPGPTDSAVDPAIAEEEQRVREALDQSFVGTLSASRSSTGAGTSTHTSIRDLRLSFPDPLTSSRNDLNRSFETVSSPTETSVTCSTDADSQVAEPAPLTVGAPLLEDPGLFITPAVQHQHHEVAQHIEDNALDIVLYGSSSEVKWKFLQDLIEKAAITSGHVLMDSFREDAQTQTLRLIKDTEGFTPFFNVINASDRTLEIVAKAETDDFGTATRRSLAIVYLPTPQLPILSWHSSYLPVLVPSVTELDHEMMAQAAEDDWDLLGVPANKMIKLGYNKSPVLDANELTSIDSTHVYEVLRNIGNDTKKIAALKPLTEHVKSMNAVTLFALMSIIMGFAFNTSFRSSTPAPTPTVNGPLSNNGHVWSFFAPQPNRSILAPSTALQNTKSDVSPSLKDMAVSVFNPGSTSLSMTIPASSKSLSMTGSSSNAIVEMTTTSPVAKCQHCAEKPLSTDVVLRSTVATSLSASPRPEAVVASRSGSASTILLAAADRAAGIPKSTVATVASAAAVSLKLNSAVSNVLDATSKRLAEAMGSDLTELAEAADDLLDSVIRQSKGKARAFGEQIQNLNEEVVARNERAKQRARELKKMGGELMREARKEFAQRTVKAKKRAKALRKSVVDGGTEAWKTYEQAQVSLEAVLAEKKRDKKSRGRKIKDDAENVDVKGCERRERSQARWARRAEGKARMDGKGVCV